MNFFEKMISDAKIHNCPICNIALIDKIKINECFECNKCNFIMSYNQICFEKDKIDYRILHWEKSKYQDEESRLLIYYNGQYIYYCTFEIINNEIIRGYDFDNETMNIERIKNIKNLEELYEFGKDCLKWHIFK